MGAQGRCQEAEKESSGPGYERYGLTMFLVDAAVVTAGFLSEDERVFAVGYLAAGPSVHFLEGGTDVVIWSLGMRALLPFAGGAIAVYSSDCSGECDFGSALLGVGVGLAAAYTVDWLVLAKKPAPTPRLGDGGAGRGSALAPTLVPTLVVDTGQVQVGIGGRF
ncbi:hypothetical protein [Haliangium sp.]|uniref:hypothetical protein n=1 Tax=Haliangium sp. TaxID=2663208 RepID=UPI003D0FA772